MIPADYHSEAEHDSLNATPSIIVNSHNTLGLSSDWTETTLSVGHIEDEKCETVKGYSSFK